MKKLCLAFSALAVFTVGQVSAAPTIKHNHITPWDHTLPAVQSLLQPSVWFKGCDPYPSVNHEGKVSGGLKNTGKARSGCHDGSKKQVHYRGQCFTERHRKLNGLEVIGKGKVGRGKVCAHMYSYYFPKDVGTIPGIFGHRHDWEDIIVWTRNVNNQGQKVIGVSFSAHGQYKKVKADKVNRDKTRAKAVYKIHNATTHSMHHATSDEVRTKASKFNGPLKVFNYHTQKKSNPATLTALASHGWGSSVYSMSDSRFPELLKRSWTNNWSNYAGMWWRP